METIRVQRMQAEEMPRLLLILLRASLYLPVCIVLSFSINILNEVDAPLGTLRWLSTQGVDLRLVGVFVALCAGVGAALWHRVRRKPLLAIGLYIVTAFPYLAYCSIASYYVKNIAQGSGMAITSYWGGFLLGGLLIWIVALFLAWAEVTELRELP